MPDISNCGWCQSRRMCLWIHGEPEFQNQIKNDLSAFVMLCNPAKTSNPAYTSKTTSCFNDADIDNRRQTICDACLQGPACRNCISRFYRSVPFCEACPGTSGFLIYAAFFGIILLLAPILIKLAQSQGRAATSRVSTSLGQLWRLYIYISILKPPFASPLAWSTMSWLAISLRIVADRFSCNQPLSCVPKQVLEL